MGTESGLVLTVQLGCQCMSTQATPLNVQGMDAVTPSNEDLNIFQDSDNPSTPPSNLTMINRQLGRTPAELQSGYPPHLPNDWCK